MRLDEDWREIAGLLLGLLAAGAAVLAAFDLVGLPMLSRSAMNPTRGWVSLAVAFPCGIASWRILRKGRSPRG